MEGMLCRKKLLFYGIFKSLVIWGTKYMWKEKYFHPSLKKILLFMTVFLWSLQVCCFLLISSSLTGPDFTFLSWRVSFLDVTIGQSGGGYPLIWVVSVSLVVVSQRVLFVCVLSNVDRICSPPKAEGTSLASFSTNCRSGAKFISPLLLFRWNCCT